MSLDISIIIPFLNEEKNIPSLVEKISSFIEENRQISFEVIFVDDGSTDNSVAMLEDFGYSSKIVKLSKNYGSHPALRAGIQHANGKYIIFMYADLQDPLELNLALHKEIEKGFDIVWAQRNNTTSDIFSSIYSVLMKKFVNPLYPKQGFDIVMFNRKVQSILNENVESNSNIFLQILDLGFKQTTIKYDKKKREFGKSKWTFSKKIKIFIGSFVAFSFAPIRFVSISGIIIFLAGIIWSVYIVLRALILNDLDPGWPTLISILLLGFGITNISIGILAEYLWRTLDAARKRPVFVIDEIIEGKTIDE